MISTNYSLKPQQPPVINALAINDTDTLNKICSILQPFVSAENYVDIEERSNGVFNDYIIGFYANGEPSQTTAWEIAMLLADNDSALAHTIPLSYDNARYEIVAICESDVLHNFWIQCLIRDERLRIGNKLKGDPSAKCSLMTKVAPPLVKEPPPAPRPEPVTPPVEKKGSNPYRDFFDPVTTAQLARLKVRDISHALNAYSDYDQTTQARLDISTHGIKLVKPAIDSIYTTYQQRIIDSRIKDYPKGCTMVEWMLTDSASNEEYKFGVVVTSRDKVRRIRSIPSTSGVDNQDDPSVVVFISPRKSHGLNTYLFTDTIFHDDNASTYDGTSGFKSARDLAGVRILALRALLAIREALPVK